MEIEELKEDKDCIKMKIDEFKENVKVVYEDEECIKMEIDEDCFEDIE